MPKTYTVEKDYQNSRFDKWFKAKIINLPQSLVEKIIRLNKIKVNRKRPKSSYRVQSGDIVEVYDISKFKANDKIRLSKYKKYIQGIWRWKQYSFFSRYRILLLFVL